MVEGDFQQRDLHNHHEKRLQQEARVELGTGPVEDSVITQSAALSEAWRRDGESCART